MLREAFSRLLWVRRLTVDGIVAELNATLRRKEEARIYHWQQTAQAYPPRRTAEAAITAQPQATGPPPKPVPEPHPLQ